MLKKVKYSQTLKNLEKISSLNNNFKLFYNKLGPPELFDVTLRDGLQGLSREQQNEFTFENKKNLYNKICSIHNPKKIEIGSIVSKKVLPIFADSMELFNYIKENHESIKKETEKQPECFILIPNYSKLQDVINNTSINNFSFITSVSNSFQIKNTKMTLEESDQDLYNMLFQLDENKYRRFKPYIKLYVSCISNCPIEGKIDNDFIVNRLLLLNKLNVENLCLSDTCGSLEIEDFEYIIETCSFFGLHPSKFSLHLHVKPGRENIIEKIIHKALDYKIIKFDVSLLETGGCSVTMKKENLAPNLSYELYYKALYNYILKNI
jgi:isopropylmalate/homocitrate/citramalate synthase